MPRALRVCSRPGCPELHAGRGRCPACATEADKARGTPHQRGYGRQHKTRFRQGVLLKHPQCQWPEGCDEPSTVADHWPIDRRELVTRGMDPNDPANGRGLCHRHHGQATAEHQPGGWNDRATGP